MSAAEDRMVAMVYKQREKIEAVFKEFDEDGSGTVSEEEFAMALELLGVDVTKAPIAGLTEECTSGGKVNFVTFLRKVKPAGKPAPPPKKPGPPAGKPGPPAGKPGPPPGKPKPGPPAGKPGPPPGGKPGPPPGKPGPPPSVAAPPVAASPDQSRAATPEALRDSPRGPAASAPPRIGEESPTSTADIDLGITAGRVGSLTSKEKQKYEDDLAAMAAELEELRKHKKEALSSAEEMMKILKENDITVADDLAQTIKQIKRGDKCARTHAHMLSTLMAHRTPAASPPRLLLLLLSPPLLLLLLLLLSPPLLLVLLASAHAAVLSVVVVVVVAACSPVCAAWRLLSIGPTSRDFAETLRTTHAAAAAAAAAAVD